MRELKYFSTFSGIGGFEIGIEKAAAKCGIKTECVGFSEIDKFAISVYESHFGETKNYGDITKIDENELPDFDCLVGGFPCQAFSIAGKRRGFDDTRGTLFFDLARILRAKQPRLFVFENVKGLLSHDGGRTFKTIVSTLAELGYDVQWQVLDSAHFGVPQHRERVIVVGFLGNEPRPQIFPFANCDRQTLFDNEIVISTAKRRSISRKSSVINTITASYRGPDGDGKPGIITEDGIRRLTPNECEKLQGFPKDWTRYGANGKITSDSQRYKMCGNAVTTNVIEAVFGEIFKQMKRNEITK